MTMTKASFSAFADELRKLASANSTFRFLDRSGNMGGSSLPSVSNRIGRASGGIGNIPKFNTFAKRAEYVSAGVANADLKTVNEDDQVPAVRKKISERLDKEGWKQTAKDMPVVMLGTGLGYGVGKTVSEEIGKRLGVSGRRPGWTKHVPLATSIASSMGSYAMGRSREKMRQRRQAHHKAER